MLEGKCRVTALDMEGGNYLGDVEKGDLWYFPAGHPHSLQGLSAGGCEFLLIFDDGNFSEDSTFLLSDFVGMHLSPLVQEVCRVTNTEQPTLRRLFCPRTSASIPISSPTYQPKNDTSSRDLSPELLMTKHQPESRRLATASRTKCSPKNPSKHPAAKFASRTPPTSRLAQRSPPHMSPSNPTASARCIGTPTPTNGPTLSAGAPASPSSPRLIWLGPSITCPATSVSCLKAWATTSRTSVTRSWNFWRYFARQNSRILVSNSGLRLRRAEMWRSTCSRRTRGPGENL